MTATAEIDKPGTTQTALEIPHGPHIMSDELVPPPVQSKRCKKARKKRRAASLSARYAPAALRSRWLKARLRDIPSWLSSMVLHMTFILTLSSVVIPQQRSEILAQLTLTLASQEEESGEETGDWVVELPATAGLIGEVPTAPKETAPVQVPKQQESPPEKEEEESPQEISDWVVNSELLHAEQVVDPPKKPVPAIASGGPVASNKADFSSVNKDGKRHQENPLVDEDATDDEIVEAFIQYDIGNLRGREGQTALRRFQRLDSSALPALIRGLNRSANIAASCPVMVLSSTVVKTIAASDDPSSLDYALDNIGRDVPSDAPHHSRLRGVLSGLKQMVAQQRKAAEKLQEQQEDQRTRETRLAERLAAQGYHVNSEIAAEVIRLMGRSSHLTLAQLRSPEHADSPLAVAIAAGQWSRSSPESFRLDCGDLLTQWLSYDDPQIAHNAHLALVRIAEGRDLGPADNVTVGEHRAAVERWQDLWETRRSQMNETAALRLLKMAEGLHRAGKREKVIKRYRELAKKFPGTKSGQAAQRRLRGLR